MGKALALHALAGKYYLHSPGSIGQNHLPVPVHLSGERGPSAQRVIPEPGADHVHSNTAATHTQTESHSTTAN